MSFLKKEADEEILTEIGNRLASLRLEKNLTQADLAEQAGVGARTIQRLEAGAPGTQLSGLIRVSRVLGILERLDAFIPDAQERPMDLLKRQGKRRKRASGQSTEAGDTGESKWTWEDDA